MTEIFQQHLAPPSQSSPSNVWLRTKSCETGSPPLSLQAMQRSCLTSFDREGRITVVASTRKYSVRSGDDIGLRSALNANLVRFPVIVENGNVVDLGAIAARARQQGLSPI